MSVLPNPRPTLSEEEYLALERAGKLKHEYIDGQMYATVGASRTHNLINTNVVATFHGQLRGRPCEHYSSDMKVKIEAAGIYTYPDVSIVCGEAQFADNEFDALLNPTVLIEILSPQQRCMIGG